MVQNVHDLGGRSFWIHNTGPVGCLAYVLDRVPITPGQVDKVGCAAPFNEVAKYYNLKLKEAVVELRKELPSAALTYVDVYSVKYELFSHATKHGIFIYMMISLFFLIIYVYVDESEEEAESVGYMKLQGLSTRCVLAVGMEGSTTTTCIMGVGVRSK